MKSIKNVDVVVSRNKKLKPFTVLISGEHTLLRGFVRVWLMGIRELHFVAESHSALHTMDVASKLKPSLILMDFDSLQKNSLEVLDGIKRKFPKIAVIIYFAHSHNEMAIRVIRAGASGYVLKSAEVKDLETAIKTVMNGGVYLSPDFLKSIGNKVLGAGVPDRHGKSLSPRQAEILKLAALGLSTKAIGYELKISGKTVDVHKQAIMRRLGVDNPAALVRYAIKHGVVPI